MEIQRYNKGQDQEIINLYTQTFTASEGAEEGNLIGNLVKQLLEDTPDSKKSVFIASQSNRVLGAVIFTKLIFENSNTNTWLLSPAAVSTQHQGQGIGKKLIDFAHKALKEEGVQQVVTYGDIRFYSKVGYKGITEDDIPSPLTLSYPEGWIAQSLENDEIAPISGRAFCVEAFNNPKLW